MPSQDGPHRDPERQPIDLQVGYLRVRYLLDALRPPFALAGVRLVPLSFVLVFCLMGRQSFLRKGW